MAAFGDKAVAAAAAHADRMLLDVVSPEQVRALRGRLDAAAEGAGRRPPVLAAWLPAAVDPAPESLTQVLGSIAGYLTVPGYREVFAEAGFEDAVELAASGADRAVLVRALPPEPPPPWGWWATRTPYDPGSTPMPRRGSTRSPSFRRRTVIRRGSGR